MTITENTKILIVGLGLIGGSYAMALSRQGYKVSAITLEESSVKYALEKDLIVYGTTTPEPELIAQSELIIFSLYPHVFKQWIKDYGRYISPGTLVTDVTGIKSGIVYDIQAMLPKGAEFIPAHPMAGREVYGVENSDDSIFRGANYIVTPTAANTPQAIEECKKLGAILGFAAISVLSPEQHDDMIAFLSQLTHCIAVALMTCNDTEGMEFYTGDSFRDLTRIARINDDMWSELFMLNRDALLRHMTAFENELDKLRRTLLTSDRDEMRRMMRKSTQRRALFDKKI